MICLSCLSCYLVFFFLISDHISLFIVSSLYQDGSLPIHLAASKGRVEVVRVLLECDPSTVSVENDVS